MTNTLAQLIGAPLLCIALGAVIGLVFPPKLDRHVPRTTGLAAVVAALLVGYVDVDGLVPTTVPALVAMAMVAATGTAAYHWPRPRGEVRSAPLDAPDVRRGIRRSYLVTTGTALTLLLVLGLGCEVANLSGATWFRQALIAMHHNTFLISDATMAGGLLVTISALVACSVWGWRLVGNIPPSTSVASWERWRASRRILRCVCVGAAGSLLLLSFDAFRALYRIGWDRVVGGYPGSGPTQPQSEPFLWMAWVIFGLGVGALLVTYYGFVVQPFEVDQSTKGARTPKIPPRGEAFPS